MHAKGRIAGAKWFARSAITLGSDPRIPPVADAQYLIGYYSEVIRLCLDQIRDCTLLLSETNGGND